MDTTQNQETENNVNVKEYNHFMKWFTTTHPDLAEKYSRNISLSSQMGSGIIVHNGYALTKDEHDMLQRVVKEYHTPDK